MERFPRRSPGTDAILPLKLDIDVDIRARLIQQGEPVDPDLLRRVLANHTGRAGYLLALIHRRDGRRHDLDGETGWRGGRPGPERGGPITRQAPRNGRKRRPPATGNTKALEKQQQRAKAERIAEREERRAAEKQRRRESTSATVSGASNGGPPRHGRGRRASRRRGKNRPADGHPQKRRRIEPRDLIQNREIEARRSGAEGLGRAVRLTPPATGAYHHVGLGQSRREARGAG